MEQANIRGNPKIVGVDKPKACAHKIEQNMGSSVRYFGLSLGLTLCWLIAIWFITPDFSRDNVRAIRAADVLLVEDLKGDIRGLVQSSQQHAAKTRSMGTVSRQASFTLPNKDGVTVIVPRLQVESGLLVNNIPLGTEGPVPAAGPALGPRQNYARVPPIFLGFSPNRFDIVALDGFGWLGVGPIWYADFANGSGFVAKLGAHQAFLGKASFWIALLGILASFIGIFFQANRSIFIGGLALSLIFLGQVQTLVPNFVLWIAILLVSFAGWARVLRRHNVLSSFAGCAALSSFAGLLVIVYTPAPTLYIKLATLSVVGIWPLLGVALPILAADRLRGLASDFVAARAKIADQELTIQNQQVDLHAAIKSSAINEERQRFVRDMHDGVGGQLLSLLMQMRSKTIAPDDVELELQRGLHDLRLMADSLDNVGSDLDMALTAFERRAAQQLTAAGIALTWSKGSDLKLLAWDGRKILNLYRVLQEALTNCVRHAKATTITFAFELDAAAKGLNVTITDNGIGMKPEVKKGRGLTNITKRAAAMGASVTYASGPEGKGTVISLQTTI